MAATTRSIGSSTSRTRFTPTIPRPSPGTLAPPTPWTPRSWRRFWSKGERRGLVFKALYHSHPDHDAYFSAEDKACATPFGEPTYPDTAQIVISVMNGDVGRVAVYAWSPDAGDYVEITLVRVRDR